MLTTLSKTRENIAGGMFDKTFARLYPSTPPTVAQERWLGAIAEFESIFGTEREITLVSAPGRTEIGGNHTDHQRGRVLAAAVNLDTICVVSPNTENRIHIVSKNHKPDIIDLNALEPLAGEAGHAASLIRGIVVWFKQNGYKVGGLDAYTTSDVLSGSGLSSSAAFEVAVGNMLNILYNGCTVTATEIAVAGQYAENAYFGKPSGLMDQMASSVGGFVHIDFADPQKPTVTPVDFDLAAAGYTLCVVDTKGSHSDLTSAYAAIPAEMKAVASAFGKEYLSETDEAAFYSDIPRLRSVAGDRAVMRAMHFFAENARVTAQADALRCGDVQEFLKLVIESGESSFCCLQNIYAAPDEQGISIALALSKRVLAGRGGAWRVHGGGFAGTILAFVPNALLEEYRGALNSALGENACRSLTVRPTGGGEVRSDFNH